MAKPRQGIRTEASADRAEVVASRSTTPTFAELLERRISRRGLLKAGAAAGALAITGPLLRSGQDRVASAQGGPVGRDVAMIAFQPIPPQPSDSQQVVVADGHAWDILIRWGEPLRHGGPEFDPTSLTRETQEQQFGYNNDFIGWLTKPIDGALRGVLWVNHEYTNAHLMWPDYEEGNPTREQADVELAAHGGSVVELLRAPDGRMVVDKHSPLNRRVTATTPMMLSGPAAGHPWLQTADDPSGAWVAGTLNNCAGGITPWGTILTCEENFQSYFGYLKFLPEEDPRHEVHARYGLEEEGTAYGWEQHYGRFAVSTAPNEPFRFGWVVEVDPWHPESIPVKRTALGRFRHEGATFGHSPSGRVVFYSGDDQRFEYAYKYVSDNAWDPLKSGMEQGLLDEGTLYVARFSEDGTGEWLPLVQGEGPLTAENGFATQGDVLVKTRLAADLLGATRMDRPEDMQQNMVNRRVYLALTNNTRREADDTDPSNPRAENRWGHVIEITEDGDDAAATTFTWEIFLLCGDPEDESTYFQGIPKELVSPIANPDNLFFGNDGTLWISTDGQPGSLDLADALHAVPTAGPQRGMVAQFLSVVAGAECASGIFSEDQQNLFVSIQHPGEDGTLAEPQTMWPDGGPLPRPAVIQVWNTQGRKVGGSW